MSIECFRNLKTFVRVKGWKFTAFVLLGRVSSLSASGDDGSGNTFAPAMEKKLFPQGEAYGRFETEYMGKTQALSGCCFMAFGYWFICYRRFRISFLASICTALASKFILWIWLLVERGQFSTGALLTHMFCSFFSVAVPKLRLNWTDSLSVALYWNEEMLEKLWSFWILWLQEVFDKACEMLWGRANSFWSRGSFSSRSSFTALISTGRECVF